MASEELIMKLQHQLDNTYGKFRSVMPRALKGSVEEHMKLDEELTEDEDAIHDVHQYHVDQLIDLLWDVMGENMSDISVGAKMEYSLGDYRLSDEDKRFMDKETEYRERDSEGL